MRPGKRYRKRWCYTLCGARRSQLAPRPGVRRPLNPPLFPPRPLPRPFHHCATSVAAADTLIKFEGWKGRARARAYGYTYSSPRILEYPQGKSPIRLSPTRRIRAKIREKSFSRSLRAFIIYRPARDCSCVCADRREDSTPFPSEWESREVIFLAKNGVNSSKSRVRASCLDIENFTVLLSSNSIINRTLQLQYTLP